MGGFCCICQEYAVELVYRSVCEDDCRDIVGEHLEFECENCGHYYEEDY